MSFLDDNAALAFRLRQEFRKIARMRVPKLVKNGFNSVPRVRVTLGRLDSEWKSGTSASTKRRIKTIFNHFRNRHARSVSCERVLLS
jgi:hypothetical protein